MDLFCSRASVCQCIDLAQRRFNEVKQFMGSMGYYSGTHGTAKLRLSVFCSSFAACVVDGLAGVHLFFSFLIYRCANT